MPSETRRIYHADAYIQAFTAQVVSCNPKQEQFEIILDQTAFYPEGGGQPADLGTLAGARILDVQEKNGEIIHLTDSPLPVGAEVSGEIDWPVRFERMQHHTGEHIVSGIVNRLFGFDNIGFRMGSEGVTIDFSGVLAEDMLDQVEQLANEAVFQNIPVMPEFPAPDVLSEMTYRSKKALDGDVRIVRIPDVDQCACCGTHTRTTGEVGLIKFIKSEKYKGGTRVTLLCGMKALLDYREKARSIAAISGCLSAKPSEISQAVEKMSQELLIAKKAAAALKQQLWELKAAQMDSGSGYAIVFEPDLSPEDLRQYGQILISKVKLALVFSPNGDSEFKYAICSSGTDIKTLAAALNNHFSGRGGGKPTFCQGSIRGEQQAIEEFIERRFRVRQTF